MIIVIIIIALLVIAVIMIYNSLIQKKNGVDNAFYSIDVMLKKRYDLIPQLVETVKGYARHEKEVLGQLTEMRQKAIRNDLTVNDKVMLDNQITDALQKVIISVEAYPELKASDNFLKLQGAINEAEEQLAASRRYYNAAVTDYHNGIQMFPSSFIASRMGLKTKAFFSIPDAEKVVPLININ